MEIFHSPSLRLTFSIFFEPFGSVTEIKVVTDRETGQPGGFAFVTMGSDAEGRADIISLDGKEFGGRPLKSARLVPKKIGPHDLPHVRADSGDLRDRKVWGEPRSCDVIRQGGASLNIFRPLNHIL